MEEFSKEAELIIEKAKEECAWMYETNTPDMKYAGVINYTVWSDVFICPNCGHEIIFYDVAVEPDSGKVSEEFSCNSCGALLKKKDCTVAITPYYDSSLKKNLQMVKQKPVLINYQYGKNKYFKKNRKNG